MSKNNGLRPDHSCKNPTGQNPGDCFWLKGRARRISCRKPCLLSKGHNKPTAQSGDAQQYKAADVSSISGQQRTKHAKQQGSNQPGTAPKASHNHASRKRTNRRPKHEGCHWQCGKRLVINQQNRSKNRSGRKNNRRHTTSKRLGKRQKQRIALCQSVINQRSRQSICHNVNLSKNAGRNRQPNQFHVMSNHRAHQIICNFGRYTHNPMKIRHAA
ncbi:hypothetical protein PSE_3581 [Pseudovibrio sp. FO-BEG1]|nr:hypothetical protein PSE_3581 [Pseudovibrio sp. FO-BEG1]